MEELGLRESVLAGGGIQHQHDLVRRSGQVFADHPPDLLQLFHQVDAGVQPPGSVNDDHVVVLGNALGHAVKDH